MGDMNRLLEKPGLLALGFVGVSVALFGVISGLRGMFASLDPVATPIPPSRGNTTFATPFSTIAPTEEPQSLATLDTAWVQDFYYPFAAGSWSVGAHSYQMEFMCATSDVSNQLEGSWEGAFEVSPGAPLVPEPVVLADGGPMIGWPDGQLITTLHPDQEAIAVASLEEFAMIQAGFQPGDCSVALYVDEQAPVLMLVWP